MFPTPFLLSAFPHTHTHTHTHTRPNRFGKPPRMTKNVQSGTAPCKPLELTQSADEALLRVLSNPTVASKDFLVTIGDRSVTGLISRDQMVGKWQVPLSNVAVTASSYDSFVGEAMAVGERTPVASLNGPASAGLAVGEALTNVLAGDVEALTDVRFSANWMVNSGSSEEDYNLYKTCERIGMDLAPKLGIAIPVGKDSMSMKSIWTYAHPLPHHHHHHPHTTQGQGRQAEEGGCPPLCGHLRLRARP